MTPTNLENQQPRDEKAKVAYALNLCAVSISQIIDSRDIIVLKQEREFILSNLNLQNFVKHPALLEVLKQILDTITYLEIQAGDLSFIEKEYQQKLKNAIWSAVPSPGALFAGGNPVSIAIAVAAQVGTGYMNYRRNKSQYGLDRDRSEWQLKRHELEQLYGLRAQLFETAWNLSADYDFDDAFRLTQKQLSRYSDALLEEDPLKRFERLDVMSDKFAAFPPFWYYKGNAAMEVFRSETYCERIFAPAYKDEALKAYRKFQEGHFAFLREDVIAASCCIELVSLLDPNSSFVEELLHQAVRFAGDNYDVLQQSIFVNLRLKKYDAVVLPLREMIANDYNVELNVSLLSRIYLEKSALIEYEKLRVIAGERNTLSWSNDADLSEKQLVNARKKEIADAYRLMAQRIVFRLNANKSSTAENKHIFDDFCDISTELPKCVADSEALAEMLKNAEGKLREAIINTNEKNLSDFFVVAQNISEMLLSAEFTGQIVEESSKLTSKMQKAVKP